MSTQDRKPLPMPPDLAAWIESGYPAWRSHLRFDFFEDAGLGEIFRVQGKGNAHEAEGDANNALFDAIVYPPPCWALHRFIGSISHSASRRRITWRVEYIREEVAHARNVERSTRRTLESRGYPAEREVE